MSNEAFIGINDTDFSKVALKLHKQFGHPSPAKLKDLLLKSGNRSDNLLNSIDDVSNSCVICAKFKQDSYATLTGCDPGWYRS